MLTRPAKIRTEDHRPFGKTGLRVPPVMFGSSALGNAGQPIPEQTKRAIVGEWIAHVAPPLFIDTGGKHGAEFPLAMLGQTLDRFDMSADEVIINIRLGWKRVSLEGTEANSEPSVSVKLQHDAVQLISYDGILDCWHEGIRLLGGRYVPRLASLHAPDEYLAAATSPADRDLRFEAVLEAYRALLDLKSAGQVVAVGVGAKDWRIAREIDDAVQLDWVMLASGPSVLNHPLELLELITSLTQRQIPIVNSAVFHSGFLVGGHRFDNRQTTPESATERPLVAWRKAFVALCHGHGISPAHACIQFGLSPPGVIAVALNTSHPDRVAENVASVLNKVPESFWAAMKEEGLLAVDYPHLG
jgi:D-threo-aldose 1-dehydrogenase